MIPTKEAVLEMVSMADDPLGTLAVKYVQLLVENENLTQEVDGLKAESSRIRATLMRIEKDLVNILVK